MNLTNIIAQDPDIREWKARMAKIRTQWLADHVDEVAAVIPDWADPETIWVDVTEPGEVPESIEFSRVVGSVTVDQTCVIKEGVWALLDAPEIHVNFQDEAQFSIATALQVGIDLQRAATFVELGRWI